MRALLLAALLAGCAHTEVQIGSGSRSSTTTRFYATGAAALVLGVALSVSDPYRPDPAPELDPSRKVNEQDCSRAVDLFAGNLRCK